MNVSLVLVVVLAVLFACGVYLLLERSMTRVLLGILLLGNAANLLILVVAGAPGAAPIVGDEPERYSDPLPQALALTAIVITFAVSAFLLALIYRSWRLAQRDEFEDDAADIAVREERAPSEFAGTAPADETEFAEPVIPASRSAASGPADAEPAGLADQQREGGA